MPVKRILFVCHGNLCRSPLAEGVFRRIAGEAGLAVVADSAGTGVWTEGALPDLRAFDAAEARGHNLEGIRSRRLCEEDFSAFDHLIVMDRANLAVVRRLAPAGSRADSDLLLRHAGRWLRVQVPDPFMDGRFEYALDLIERGCRGLVASLQRKAAAQREQYVSAALPKLR